MSAVSPELSNWSYRLANSNARLGSCTPVAKFSTQPCCREICAALRDAQEYKRDLYRWRAYNAIQDDFFALLHQRNRRGRFFTSPCTWRVYSKLVR